MVFYVGRIADPAGAGVFLANPCSLLSVSQRAEVEQPVAEAKQSPGLVTCVLGTERNPAQPVERQRARSPPPCAR